MRPTLAVVLLTWAASGWEAFCLIATAGTPPGDPPDEAGDGAEGAVNWPRALCEACRARGGRADGPVRTGAFWMRTRKILRAIAVLIS